MPFARIFYAVKANPDPKILSTLGLLGSSFDCASVAEIEMALAAGAGPQDISFGNTIKKESDISRAFALGVRLFAFDSEAELRKLVRSAPGSDVFCRILTSGEGAEWPLSRKFGCSPAMASALLREANASGLVPRGVSFHVGSQMMLADGWNSAILEANSLFRELMGEGIILDLLNIGGGFPTAYLNKTPDQFDIGNHIFETISQLNWPTGLSIIAEPGRGMVGDAGMLLSEVILISTKSQEDDSRWVYLDIGKFGGLAETMDEAIRYKITRLNNSWEDCTLAVIAGPTCDSADVLYEKNMYPVPRDLKIGERLVIENTGAYTTTYASVAFNGFEPLKSYVI
jgi:ornithine decarboxylase